MSGVREDLSEFLDAVDIVLGEQFPALYEGRFSDYTDPDDFKTDIANAAEEAAEQVGLDGSDPEVLGELIEAIHARFAIPAAEEFFRGPNP